MQILSNMISFLKFVLGLFGPFSFAGCLVFGPFWQVKLHESNFYRFKASKGLSNLTLNELQKTYSMFLPIGNVIHSFEISIPDNLKYLPKITTY